MQITIPNLSNVIVFEAVVFLTQFVCWKYNTVLLLH